jgi:hypothetical protein
MQQHPTEIYSPLSTLQTRNASWFATHIGKTKAHNNSVGNDHADHLANTIVDGQPPDAIYFRGAHTHLGHWTWPYTIQDNDSHPPETLLCTNLKTGARKYSSG